MAELSINVGEDINTGDSMGGVPPKSPPKKKENYGVGEDRKEMTDQLFDGVSLYARPPEYGFSTCFYFNQP